VYSHRSTQKYKRKPFVSHYWDCRLKGRPPGTPKSDDPNKKKRKRVARERNLCDVKIKITEYLPGATQGDVVGHLGQQPRADGGDGAPDIDPVIQAQQIFGLNAIDPEALLVPPGTPGTGRYYTMQRVNGNGANGKNDGVAGPHKHSLEDSDRVKKNSVERWVAKNEKEVKSKKIQVSLHILCVYVAYVCDCLFKFCFARRRGADPNGWTTRFRTLSIVVHVR